MTAHDDRSADVVSGDELPEWRRRELLLHGRPTVIPAAEMARRSVAFAA
jgi:hypothetical protein